MLVLALSGCSLIEPSKEAPYYIKIDSIPFRDSTQFYQTRNNGKNAVEISDAWVFANGKFIGMFQMPALVPIDVEGGPEVRLSIEPGVRADGMSDFRVSYPFYKRWDRTLNLVRGVPTPVNFTTTYKSDGISLKVPMPIYLDFESTSDSAQLIPAGDNRAASVLTGLPGDVYPDGGRSSLLLQGVAGQSGTLDFRSSSTFKVSRVENASVYLEMNYKCNVPFLVGLHFNAGNEGQGSIFDMNLLPTNGQWRKVYISLLDEAFMTPRNSDFRLGIRASMNGSGTEKIIIDNVRLLMYNR